MESQVAYIRWMIRRDMPSVMAIENASFEFPYSEEEYILMLRRRNVIGMVAETNSQVIGFMIYELFKYGLFVHSLAVDPDFRLQQVGTEMVNKLIGKLSYQRRSRIVLLVREKNLAAQMFLKSLGFFATDVVSNYYSVSDESAYRFVYRVKVNHEV